MQGTTDKSAWNDEAITTLSRKARRHEQVDIALLGLLLLGVVLPMLEALWPTLAGQ